MFNIDHREHSKSRILELSNMISHYVNSQRHLMKNDVVFALAATWDYGGCFEVLHH